MAERQAPAPTPPDNDPDLEQKPEAEVTSETPGAEVGAPNPTVNGPIPRMQGFTQSATYVFYDDDIFASSFGRAIGGYTFHAASVTPAANGDMIVREGTVLAVDATYKMAVPRTGGAGAVMVLLRSINAREGDVEVSVVKGGRLNANKLRDGASTGSATKGAVLSPTIISALAAVGIFVDNTDA